MLSVTVSHIITEPFFGLFPMHSFPGVDKTRSLQPEVFLLKEKYWQIEISSVNMVWTTERVLSFTLTANHV